MIANGPTTQDGQYYEKGQEIPDLGSWVATSVDGLVRNYQGLSADKEKLPKYDNLQTGSSAFCVDTLEIGYYEKTTNTWYWS